MAPLAAAGLGIGSRWVAWADVELIADQPNGSFIVGGDRPERIQAFSASTGRPVSLMPAGLRLPPTALIAGFSMHRWGKASG